MICISIAQESRRLVLVDILNAVMLGADMVEVRLDCFEKDPNIGELFANKRKPILCSCRRPEDGGNWDGTEEERLMLLRQAIISGADFVEMEADVADQIRPYPGCKRVIAYTNLKETPADLAEIYEGMLQQKPDVVKIVTRARTPEEAWPLVQLIPKATVPTVVFGLGRPGVMLAVLGRRLGAPWTVAALERGMEAYPGQPTIRDLEQIYRYREIGKGTRFVGVTGLAERDFLLTGLLNAAFVELQKPQRCLPLQVGNPKTFRKIIEAVKLQAVVLDESNREGTHAIAAYDDSSRVPVQAADFLAPTADGWVAQNHFGEAAVRAIEASMPPRENGESPLRGRMAMLVGDTPTVRMIAPSLKARGASLIFACKQREASARLSQLFGGRQILFDALYTTSHDVLIYPGDPQTEEEDETPQSQSHSRGGIHPGYLRPGMTIFDVSQMPRLTPLLREATQRGCAIVDPKTMLVEYARCMVEQIVGETIASEFLREWLSNWVEDDTEENV
ncbi:type I 3-dehydroquinate dehydratase [Tuwongella immobilis]|uniref:3-dehydroquinate dehydratase n=1 Tax=Tuwongella immobilis TaxID=692036 RepID=A0A6C2YQF0_9BACT|nr:type I 3-dehydroquinate dehydratase [Tuwongella immobilis]VIP03614.1 3-dehydroquinate dehydratase : 3-dehydroquinate dehydratase-like protein OS=Planctomyces limnophilus (strain ATCC 43296 / DSM 3776 / IFAM 1008 / 290) GN=Plim_1543 PE=4 SV=1: DHquinase_I [Tuwongella immobilis]VTS04596.1 3-dehydroquinate dehydratase : 3-dehydroquinate dehydratase-like protein OS=Planctomyces limnophilus (strain ATCC 43296 / DSM 3776 / IFAM 1008 / 290) GN=Plim_1543 PE=4 SV=1: DHquinase_I [Tuwongella immobilis]